MKLITTTLSIMILNIMTLSIMILSILTLSIMTLSLITLSITDTEYNNALHYVIKLNVAFYLLLSWVSLC